MSEAAGFLLSCSCCILPLQKCAKDTTGDVSISVLANEAEVKVPTEVWDSWSLGSAMSICEVAEASHRVNFEADMMRLVNSGLVSHA